MLKEILDVRTGEYITFEINCQKDKLKFLIKYDFLKDVLNCKVSTEQYMKYKDVLFKDDAIYYSNIVDSLNEQLDVNCIALFDNYYRNQYRRINRIRDKLDYEILSNVDEVLRPYFITLTLENFYDEESLTQEQYAIIRKEIRLFVKDYCSYYVLNKDFGLTSSKRLHFHGVVLMPLVLRDEFIYNAEIKFGFCNLEYIDANSCALSKYINKLSFHALKVDYGAKRECLIYCRKFN